MKNYKISYDKVLGKGAFAQVFPAKHSTIDDEMVVKLMLRKNLDAEAIVGLEAEVMSLRKLNHPNVVKMYDFLEDKRAFYLFMERVQGGELFERIQKKSSYSELEARSLCQQIIEAIKHCHDNDIVHRDIKPENLMMVSPEDDSKIRLVDFGFSCECTTSSLTEVLGTPIYMAPELWLSVPYGKAVDLWSFGIIAYTVLSGYLPFRGSDFNSLTTAILSADVDFESSPWDLISSEAKNFVRGLLNPDQSLRLTATGALQHAWVSCIPELLRICCCCYCWCWCVVQHMTNLFYCLYYLY